jgi:hypothetical protein
VRKYIEFDIQKTGNVWRSNIRDGQNTIQPQKSQTTKATHEASTIVRRRQPFCLIENDSKSLVFNMKTAHSSLAHNTPYNLWLDQNTSY